MKNSMMRCMRCKGRKKLFKVNSGYTYTNTGGIEVACPLCLGKGEIPPLENIVIVDEIVETPKKNTKHKKTIIPKDEEIKDVERTSQES